MFANVGWGEMLVLVVVGLVETVQFVKHHHTPPGDLALVVVSLVIGAGLAAVRAHTITLWRDPSGVVLRRGTAWTAVLWIASLGQHLLIDAFVHTGLGAVSLLLYFGVVLLVHQCLLLLRAGRAGLIEAGAL